MPAGAGPLAPERMPVLVGCVTLAVGSALVAAPQLGTRPLRLAGQEAALRAIGAADLALVPGLLAGRARWPWMTARAALDVVQAASLWQLARHAGQPERAQAAAGVLLGLTLADGATAVALRRGRR